MALYNFNISAGQSLAFSPAVDVLQFSTQSAAYVTLVQQGSDVGVSVSGHTVHLLGLSLGEITTTNFSFADGSLLIIGDNNTGTVNDGLGNTINLAADLHDNLVMGLGGNDSITAGSGNDALYGNLGDDSLSATPGIGHTSSLYGGQGNDYIHDDGMAAGSMVVFGGAGSDVIDLARVSGSTLIYGGNAGNSALDGNDIITAGTGDSVIYGNGGDDEIEANPAAGHTAIIYGGQGNDVIFAAGAGGDMLVYGGAGADHISAVTSGDVTLYGGNGGPLPTDGNDTISGGTGNSLIYGNGGNDWLYVDADTTHNASSVYGGQGNDNLYGGGAFGDLHLFGGVGNDTLTGGAGDDTLVGGSGADSMAGGDGNDIFYFQTTGEETGDTINGNAGTDTILVSGMGQHFAFGNDSVSAFSGIEILQWEGASTAAITMSQAEIESLGSIIGGAGAETLVVSDHTLNLWKVSVTDLDLLQMSGSGNKLYVSADNLAGLTSLDGGTGNNDLIAISPGTYNYSTKTITHMNLVGTLGADTLIGTNGNDTIYGDGGHDWLSGGAGNDVFAFRNVDDNGAVILDFNINAGGAHDVIGIKAGGFGALSLQNVHVGTAALATSGSVIVLSDANHDGAGNTGFLDAEAAINTAHPGTTDYLAIFYNNSTHQIEGWYDHNSSVAGGTLLFSIDGFPASPTDHSDLAAFSSANFLDL